MLTSIILTITILLFFVFFIVSKREILLRIFSFNATLPSNELKDQLEQTADTILRRLEDQIAHLEYLLEEADIKIGILSKQIQHNNIIKEKPDDELRQKTTSVKPQLEDDELQSVCRQIPILTDQDYNLTISSGNLPEQTEDKSQTQEVVSSDKHRLILAMADQGYSVLEIAKATGMGKGEIMLLLQLNKK